MPDSVSQLSRHWKYRHDWDPYSRLMRLSIINPLRGGPGKCFGWEIWRQTKLLVWIEYVLHTASLIHRITNISFDVPPRLLKVRREAANKSLNHRTEKTGWENVSTAVSEMCCLVHAGPLSRKIDSYQPRSFIHKTHCILNEHQTIILKLVTTESR